MRILAAYDTIGIQSYIFASNKLGENVGASKLVADLFNKLLPTVISKCIGQTLPDWRKGGQLDDNLKAEIIYQGGGNSYVKFLDEEIFQTITKRFLVEVNKIAPGVGIAIAAVETSFSNNYKSDFKTLNKRLMLIKGGFNIPVFAGNQPITKQSVRTGSPVSYYEHDEYISVAQKKKREKYAVHKTDSNSGIEQFEDLVLEKGKDSFIAIIHADGNNMGSGIREYMKNFDDYESAVPKIRELAVNIDKCYAEARCRTIVAFTKEFQAKYPDYASQLKSSKSQEDDGNNEIPLIELIGDGDDTTVVISGRFALDFAARLLREIENTAPEKRPFGKNVIPTACAGVVVFRSHYPFSEAYKLVESLCSNAKKPSRETKGSHIDFHLHYSGNVSVLSQLRENQYTVDNKIIIRRPWRVMLSEKENASQTKCVGNEPDFQWFEKNIKYISRMPRNKTKALRNAIGAGDTAAKIAENQFIDTELPNLQLSKKDMSEYAALFDILELYDVYENLLNNEEAANDNK